MKRNKISVHYAIRTDRGTIECRPIFCRIYTNGKEIRFTTPFECHEQKWNKQKERPSPPTKLNELITKHEISVYQAHQFAMQNNHQFTPDFIQRYINGDIHTPKTTYYDYAMGWIKDNAKRIRYSTQKQLKSDIMKFQKFKPNIMLKDIDKGLILEYEKYLQQRLNNSPNTIQRSMKKTRMFITAALRAGLIEKNPFDGLTFKGSKPEQIKALSIAELNNIENLELSGRMDETRDIFLLQCYTGMSYSDIQTFRPDHIITVNKKKWICKDRMKTDNSAIIPIFPKTQKTLKKLKFIENGKIPIASNQKYNSNLKKIGEMAKIPFPLSSHVGRKTCGMILLNENFDYTAVSKILGHASIKTTERYYARARVELLEKQLKKSKAFR